MYGDLRSSKGRSALSKIHILSLEDATRCWSVCVLVTNPYMPEGAPSAYGFQLRMQLTLFLVVSHTTTVYRGALNRGSPFNSLAQHFHTPDYFNSTLHAESGEHVTLKICEWGRGTRKITSH